MTSTKNAILKIDHGADDLTRLTIDEELIGFVLVTLELRELAQVGGAGSSRSHVCSWRLVC
ncbi:MAG: hypothetical protein HOW73_38195 [Polyangiaceae bacterium]|nr:hypothetical protein [Polyangiaceae bacterium]